MEIPADFTDNPAAQRAVAETVLRHAESALAKGDIIGAAILLDALKPSDLFGAAFVARILSESIERAQNQRDHFVDANEMAPARKTRKAA